MANTTFVNQSTVIDASWLNDVNDVSYDVLGDGTNVPSSKAVVRTNLNVPQRDGTDASGTWGINISGTATGLTSTLAVANGGTGATTAANARTNLGLVIGTDVLAPNGDGSALTNLPQTGLGSGQTWQNVAASRAVATTYTNSTGKPICVLAGGVNGTAAVVPQVSFDGGTTWMTFARCDLPSGQAVAVGSFIVPPGATYRVGNFTTISYWWELR